jgi:hypothetical protein
MRLHSAKNGLAQIRANSISSHSRLRVAAKGVLEQPGQRRIAVRHVRARLLLAKSSNNVCKTAEGLVDALSFLQALRIGSRARVAQAFGATAQGKLGLAANQRRLKNL